MVRPLGTARVDLAPVEAGALLGIGKDLVRGRQLLEALLGGLVARVQVRMAGLGELAIGLADLLLRRLALQPQHLVGVAHASPPRTDLEARVAPPSRAVKRPERPALGEPRRG